MPHSSKHGLASTVVAVSAVLVFAAAAVQVATDGPWPSRYTGPALLALSIHGALVLAFLGGDLWRSAASAEDGGNSFRRVTAIGAALAGWAGIWLGARDGLMVLAAGHLLLALYWFAAGGSAGHGPFGGRVAIFCAFNAVALVVAAAFGPFL